MSPRIITVLLLPVGEPSRTVTIADDLPDMQKLVDGCLEVVHLDANVALWLNEEALLRHLPQNRPAPASVARMFIDGWIRGPAFISRVSRAGNTISLTDKNVAMWKEVFR